MTTNRIGDETMTDCEVKGQCLQETLSRLEVEDTEYLKLICRYTSKTESCRRRKRLLAEIGDEAMRDAGDMIVPGAMNGGDHAIPSP